MHPLDIAYLARNYGVEATGIEGAYVLGVEIVPDEAVERGKPEAVFDDQAGA